MINPTIPTYLDDAPGHHISSSSDSPLAPPKASSATEGSGASAAREFLDLLGPAHPQARAAMESII
jgi:hypothetical protein